MAAHLGAHETMEIHEILTSAINGINHFQLYRSMVTDQQLSQILDRHAQMMMSEYQTAVQSLNQQGSGQMTPYRTMENQTPKYGLDHPAPQSPNLTGSTFDDRAIATAMLLCHKNSAAKKMMAALECADPQVRRMLQQGSVNCAEQAYEVWQYMNRMGYYQVPTMKEETTNTILQTYQPAANAMSQPINETFPFRQ
ncbi:MULTISPECIES: spore coat protein [unclassified Paenibacillus]|uniref:spore coat protein n=1 Tax=unclassified Paenibacillus TaxID=185978 RepID=UPI00104B8CA6|nr:MULTISPECIES: spore coat protein [unclassified Paenibacillus]NIK68634.1 spore coat protein CotF [Paenibacillus sp. BK720]TCM99078.1 spore coat protein CotF [Paenibacillus sp. BK033]